MEGFEQAVRTFTLLLSTGVEGAAGLVVAFGVGQAVVGAARRPSSSRTLEVRLRLGRWLALALELLLAADILRTAVAPTWDDIGKLAAIATIRTLLNFFLEREVDVEERQAREERRARGELR